MKLVQRLHFALIPIVGILVVSVATIVYMWQLREYQALERDRWVSRASSALIAAEYESRAMDFLGGELAASEQFVRHLQDTGDYGVRNFLEAHINYLMSKAYVTQMGSAQLFVIDDLFTITAASSVSDPFIARELPSDIYQSVFDTHVLVSLGESFSRTRDVYVSSTGELRRTVISAYDPILSSGDKRTLTRKERSLLVVDAPMLEINQLLSEIDQLPDVSMSFGPSKSDDSSLLVSTLSNTFIDGDIYQISGYGVRLELTVLDDYFSDFRAQLLARALGYVTVILATLLAVVHIVVRLNVTGPIQNLLYDIQRGGLELRYFKRSKGNSEVAVLRNAYIDSLTKVKFEAEFDNLTKLATRKSFIDYVENRVVSCVNDNSYLLAWDIVNFRRINDIHGQDFADQLLIRLSEQMVQLASNNQNQQGVGYSDYSLSRYGSNTFCAVLSTTNVHNAKALATQFRERYFKAFSSKGFTSHIEIAMAVIPLTNQHHVKIWQKGLEETLAKAKQVTNGTPISVFDEALLAELARREEIEKQLLVCIEQGAFELNYMPLIDIKASRVSSIESLIRCPALQAKGIYPDEFIPIAEQANVIVEIDKWVLEKALFDLSRMTKDCNYTGNISVNISALELYNNGFIEQLCSICNSHAIDFSRVILEITETSYVKSTQDTIAMISTLREIGFKMSLDDFGTGFTSINQLLHYPVDELKIDKSFVDLICLKGDEKKMLKSIVALGHSCGAKVVGEGVETDLQSEYLASLECDYLQGYFISQPLQYDEFCQFYSEYQIDRKIPNITELMTVGDERSSK
ncbi:GGDEF domain-containing phosphodiesterase [Vibrio sp. 10N]|uniref:GGDEF domain-containing phosphodiesterase n=1 Tax=Vibrio sp. 10N TaxID=3058938 RepID=UPI002813C595|nr:hypothetical protein VB10N_39440 [Vibrio sp. 10N]